MPAMPPTDFRHIQFELRHKYPNITEQAIIQALREELTKQVEQMHARYLNDFFEPVLDAPVVRGSRLQKLLASGVELDNRALGSKMRNKLQEAANKYLAGVQWSELASRTRPDKRAWVAETMERIRTGENMTPVQWSLFEPVLYTHLAEKLFAAESAALGHRVPHLAFQPDELQATPIVNIAEVVTSFYLRLRVADQKGVLAAITRILADAEISIDAVLQRPGTEGDGPEALAVGESGTDLIILTHQTVEGRMRTALAQMQALPTVLDPIVKIGRASCRERVSSPV